MIIPSANTVNYSDAHEICGYQLLLCKMFEAAGGFAYPRISNKETLTIRREGKEWLKKVRKAIDDLFASPILPQKDSTGITLNDIPALLSAYDFFYRVCHGAPCFDYLRKIRLMAANRYAKGDKSISQTQVALMLRTEANRDARSMDQRYLEFSGSVMESWIEDLEKYGKLRNMPLHEAYDVLKFLLSENLFAFISSNSSKQRWIKAYTLKEEDIEALDIKTLIAYIGFEHAVENLTGQPIDEQSARHKYRFSELSTRPDLHPFYKESILIDLAS